MFRNSCGGKCEDVVMSVKGEAESLVQHLLSPVINCVSLWNSPISVGLQVKLRKNQQNSHDFNLD